MTNKINKCDGNHGGPRCADPECWNDAPVPPAGVEPEVLGWVVTDMNGDFYFAANRQTPDDTPLVDRIHVTRLQAELAEANKWRESAEGGWREANRVIAMQRERLDAQESELTKARELLSEASISLRQDERPQQANDIDAFLSNQSAPADKTGQACVVRRYERDVTGHSDVEVHASGLVHYDHGPNLAEALARLAGRVARFHKLEAPSLAERPAPVAVVMPERANAISGSHDYQSGYNTCIEDVERLNGVKL